MKWITISFVIAIVITLLSAIKPLFRRQNNKKMIKLLALRVLLSISLFVMLMVLYKMGIIHG